MALMCLMRGKRHTSQLLPEFRVIRTVRSPDHVVLDETGKWRLSSGAFRPTRDGLVSVDLEQLLVADGLSPILMYPAVDQAVAAACLTVGSIRLENLVVDHDPVPENWYHGSISGNFTKGIRRKLATAAEFLVPINEAEAQRLLDASPEK